MASRKAPAKKPSQTATTTPLIGAHMSISGGLEKSIDRGLSVGCMAMQIFVKNNMQWFAKPLTEAEIREFKEHPRRSELATVFAHSSYLINLGAVNEEFHEKSIRALREELIRADQLGLPFLVLHPGAHMGAGEEAGLEKIAHSLDMVIESIPDVQTKIALETTAGQGSSLGHTFEQLAFLLQNTRHTHQLCICVDTAHLFAAGYDITTEEGAKKTFDDLLTAIGPGRLAAFHLNDSKSALASRVDRHEHLGKGKIGLAPFRVIMREPKFAKLPKVLETPKQSDLKEDEMNLEVLRSLVAG